MTKTCFKCGRNKPVTEFYTHPQMADGYLGKCKRCTKSDVKSRYSDPKKRKEILLYEKRRNQTPERKAQKLEYQRRRRENRPGMNAAHNAISNAIRDGRLVRLPCEVCGNPKSEAHHDDYRKKFDVRWLCFEHHRKAHGQKVGL